MSLFVPWVELVALYPPPELNAGVPISHCASWQMPACPGVEMSLSWSDGRSTPSLCKQRAGEAEFTWEYGPSLCPSQHICTMPSTQEKPDSKGFRWGDGACSKWVAQHSMERGCLAGEGQALLKDKIISLALPAQTYLARVKLDYLAKTL